MSTAQRLGNTGIKPFFETLIQSP